MSNHIKTPSVHIKRLIPGIDNQTYSDLIFLYNHSDSEYTLTESPDKADIILIALPGNNMPFNTFAKGFLNLKLPPEHLDKAFAVSLRRAKHIFLMRGVYESASRYGVGSGSRIQSGAFTEKAFNSLIESAPLPTSEPRLQKKKYLFSFIGRHCHAVRDAIFKLQPDRPDVLIEDSSDFNVWSEDKPDNYTKRLQYYLDTIASSRFSLCPRGYGASSIRLFETMKLGVCPVIITDEWKLPKGPDWNLCSVIIKENQVNEIEQILTEREEEYRTLGAEAAHAYKKHFSRESYFSRIIENCLDIKEQQIIPERTSWKLRYLHYALFISLNRAKKMTRRLKRILHSIRYIIKNRF